MLESVFFTLGLISISSLVLGIIVFSRPVDRAAQTESEYQHLGIFSYSALAPQGIYDLNTIKSGDPIFPLLTCTVDVVFQYTLIALQAKDISGTYQLTATIFEPVSGWQRVVPLQEQASFTGATFGAAAQLDVCGIEALAQSMEEGTEFRPGSYRLSISPNIQLNGTVSGQVLESTFNPALNFYYDRTHFYLIRDDERNPLTAMESIFLQGSSTEPNTMFLLGSEMQITTLRWLAGIGVVISLAGFVLLGMNLQKLSNRDQDKFFRVKYDALIVDIQSGDALVASNSIEVKSMDALAKLAERFNAMILHAESRSMHNYFVQNAGTTYRFSTGAATGSAVPANDTAAQDGET